MNVCEICGREAPFFTDTYDPLKKVNRNICLCSVHQHELYVEIDLFLKLELIAQKEYKEEKKDATP